MNERILPFLYVRELRRLSHTKSTEAPEIEEGADRCKGDVLGVHQGQGKGGGSVGSVAEYGHRREGRALVSLGLAAGYVPRGDLQTMSRASMRNEGECAYRSSKVAVETSSDLREQSILDGELVDVIVVRCTREKKICCRGKLNVLQEGNTVGDRTAESDAL